MLRRHFLNSKTVGKKLLELKSAFFMLNATVGFPTCLQKEAYSAPCNLNCAHWSVKREKT